MRFSSPRGSIADSPKDNQRKRKKERKKNGTDRCVLLHLMVVLETALITRKRKKENESKKNGTDRCDLHSPHGSTGDSPQKPCSQRHTQSASLSS